MTITTLQQQLQALYQQQGFVRIDQYMRLCGAEYYAQRDPLGQRGDFITAPEVSPLFGETIALRIAQHWRTHHITHGTLFEAGAGRGTLMRDIVHVLQRLKFPQPQVIFFDCNRVLIEQQKQAVPWAHHVDNACNIPTDFPVCIIANEFFDALPVHTAQACIVWHQDKWCIQQQDNTPLYEKNHDAEDIWQQWCHTLHNAGTGSLAIIADYGYITPPQRLTVRGFYQHKVCDVTHLPGQVDVTADVDFAALQSIAQQQGLVTLCHTQYDMLTQWGIRDLWQHYAQHNAALGTRLQSGLHTLLHDMGQRFFILEATPRL